MDETRSDQIRIRCTPEEKERIEAMAEEFELKTADYVRNTALAGPVPDDTTEEIERHIEARETHQPSVPLKNDRLKFLTERITELHRDQEKRWPGRKARIQADAEWAKVKRGEPLERVELRDGFERLRPSTYELA